MNLKELGALVRAKRLSTDARILITADEMGLMGTHLVAVELGEKHGYVDRAAYERVCKWIGVDFATLEFPEDWFKGGRLNRP